MHIMALYPHHHQEFHCKLLLILAPVDFRSTYQFTAGGGLIKTNRVNFFQFKCSYSDVILIFWRWDNVSSRWLRSLDIFFGNSKPRVCWVVILNTYIFLFPEPSLNKKLAFISKRKYVSWFSPSVLSYRCDSRMLTLHIIPLQGFLN